MISNDNHMIKKVLFTLAAVLCTLSLSAQGSDWGGVKGTVVNRAGRAPIANASLVLSQQGETVATATSDADGKFLVEGLPNGMYDMTVKAARGCRSRSPRVNSIPDSPPRSTTSLST